MNAIKESIQKDILIVGGGIGGLTLAADLEKRGVSYALFESSHEIDKNGGGGLKLWPNALRAFREVGAFEALVERGSVIKSGIVKTDTGEDLARIPLGLIGEKINYPVLSLPRSEILFALREKTSDNNIHYNRKVVKVEALEDRVEIEFSDGTNAMGKVLIGADGARSQIRKKLFPERELVYAGRISWRGLLSVEKGQAPCPDEENWEYFGRGKRFGYAHMGPGKMGWYAPINNDETFAPEDVKKYLLSEFKNWPTDVQELIQKTNPDQIIRSPIRYRQFDEAWGKGRVTLLGDAAHAMTPDLAQGACMAIEDGAVLGDCLQRKGATQDALREYEKLRIPRVRNVANKSMQIGKMSNKSGALAFWATKKMWKWMPAKVAIKPIEKIVRYDFRADKTFSIKE
ncbi:MAG: FAD-dependent monooxygenase [Leptospirales bacterium]